MEKRLACTVVVALLLLALSSCDNDIVIVRYDFRQYPRLIYLANVDTELDFTGATIFHTLGNGDEEGDYPFVLRPSVSVEHSIDFTAPGEYEVAIVFHLTAHRQFPVVFTIQVVDEETYRQLQEVAR